ncbi:MAG TPA: hypothetical protein VFY23_09560 [Candidatus Limnocylindrales bacterium]|nr:hypothetical protein [Candidatus Limnocylindrales bacterium]
MSTRPVLILNPRDDADFMDVAQSFVDRGAAGPEDLQRLLRDRYPRAAVRPRDLSSEQTSVWYVYRDGHWVPSTRGREG